jgi:hypothetical protein
LKERREYAEEMRMIARTVGTVLLSTIVFVVVSLLVSLGVLWWTGGLLSGVLIGVICGLAAAFTIGAVSNVVGRTEERRRSGGDESERSGGRQVR